MKNTLNKKKWTIWFNNRKHLISNLISEGGYVIGDLKNKSTKELRDLLFIVRNPTTSVSENSSRVRDILFYSDGTPVYPSTSLKQKAGLCLVPYDGDNDGVQDTYNGKSLWHYVKCDSFN